MSKAYLINKCDVLFSKLIKAKRGKCELGGEQCGTETLQCSHNYGRSNMSVRYEELNVLCLCNTHHRLWEKMSITEKESFLKDYLGEMEFNELKRLKNEIKQWNIITLKLLVKDLKERLKRYV